MNCIIDFWLYHEEGSHARVQVDLVVGLAQVAVGSKLGMFDVRRAGQHAGLWQKMRQR